jgi:hypothetical protein
LGLRFIRVQQIHCVVETVAHAIEGDRSSVISSLQGGLY